MLSDTLSTIATTGGAAVVAAVLSFTLSRTIRGQLRAAMIIAVWFLVVVTLGATGALDPQSGAGPLGLGAAVLVPCGVVCFAFLLPGPAREAMWNVPLEALIAVNILRVLGASFVLLYAAHELPAPLAPVSGWGDIVVGLTAGPVAWIAARYGSSAKAWVLAWNVIGFVDLIAAIGLGATSSPGPIRLFTDPPGSSIMTTLPWIMIPCFLVPIWEALHIAIFLRLFPEHSSRLLNRPAVVRDTSGS
jgi:hypothetical protein